MKIYKCWQWWWIQDGVDLTASGGSSEGSNVLQVRGRQAVISHLVRLIFHDFITPALIDSLSILNWPTRVQILKTFIHFKPLLCWSNAFAPWSSSLRNKYLFSTKKGIIKYNTNHVQFLLCSMALIDCILRFRFRWAVKTKDREQLLSRREPYKSKQWSHHTDECYLDISSRNV